MLHSSVDGPTTAWLEALHPWWNGAVVGISASLLAALAVVLLRRTGRRADDLPLVASGAVVLGWIALVAADSAVEGTDATVTEPAKVMRIGSTSAAPGGVFLYACAWYNANAEISDANIKALLQAMGFTIAW